MKRELLNRKVGGELEHIPQGDDLNQNVLRYVYNSIRRNDLSVNPATPASESLNKALEQAKKDNPSFSPVYDRDFFTPRGQGEPGG